MGGLASQARHHRRVGGTRVSHLRGVPIAGNLPHQNRLSDA